MATATAPVCISRHEYEGLDCVNWSTLRYAAQSGLHYKHCLTQETEETDAMRLGRAVHAAVFEPDTFTEGFVVWDGGRRAGGAWEEFRAANLTRTIIRAEDVQTVTGITEAVRSHAVAAALLSCGQAEVSVAWRDDATGIDCKGRMDWLSDAALVDLKTTRSIDIRAFGSHAASMLYHCQLAFYQMGLHAHGLERATKIIAVESAPPHDVAVYDLDEDVLWAGEVKVREALRLVAECRKRRQWPGRYPGELSFGLPAYAFPSEEEENRAIAEGAS